MVSTMQVPKPTRLSDVVWGGRIRPTYQSRMLDIAQQSAFAVERSVRGTMVHSTETIALRFLDGGLSETRGGQGWECGVRCFGTLAMAYLLYELGAKPQDILGVQDLPSHEELRQRVRREAEAARPRREP